MQPLSLTTVMSNEVNKTAWFTAVVKSLRSYLAVGC